jgi:hypothetical protein
MQLQMTYVERAVEALRLATIALQSGTPEQRGHAAGLCTSAAIDLEVRIETGKTEMIEVTA